MARQIEITINPAGEVKILSRGYAGPACLEATRTLETALGERICENLTTEYYQSTASERQEERA